MQAQNEPILGVINLDFIDFSPVILLCEEVKGKRELQDSSSESDRGHEDEMKT